LKDPESSPHDDDEKRESASNPLLTAVCEVLCNELDRAVKLAKTEIQGSTAERKRKNMVVDFSHAYIDKILDLIAFIAISTGRPRYFQSQRWLNLLFQLLHYPFPAVPLPEEKKKK